MKSVIMEQGIFSSQFARQFQPRDSTVLARCKEGEKAAFDRLLERYRDRVLNLAFAMLHDASAAEDIAQEVFVSAFTGIHRFRGESALFTWLYRMTLNHCHRHHQRDCSWNRNNEASCSDISTSPESTVVERIAVKNALDTLTENQRAILIMREIHGLDYDEISRVLHIPVGTVRSRLHTARCRFREVWKNE